VGTDRAVQRVELAQAGQAEADDYRVKAAYQVRADRPARVTGLAHSCPCLDADLVQAGVAVQFG
jgi:hypothetical protein